MSDTDLLRMANQIAAFFGAYPDEEAVAGVAQHIRDFWDPRMRAHLPDLLAGTGLDPIARRGIERVLAATVGA